MLNPMPLSLPPKSSPLSELVIAQKYCVEAVKKCHSFQVFAQKMHSHPTPLHPFIIVGPFTKWGVYFMDYSPTSTGGNQHIIVVVDYFTKWVEAMPTIKYDGKTATFFVFNQIIALFRIPRDIVTDHGNHFQNEMMKELASKLGFKHDHSSPYYTQYNIQFFYEENISMAWGKPQQMK